MVKKQVKKPETSLYRIELSNHKTPELTQEVDRKGWVKYGKDNLYPDYLLSLFNSSTKHNAIITGKASYIVGKGWTVNDKGLTTTKKAVAFDFINAPNQNESLAELSYKVAVDLELFAGFALQPIYNKGGAFEVHHVDFSRLRSNEDNSMFYYSEDWKATTQGEKTKFRTFEKFDPKTKKGLIYFKQYRPNLKAYPYPEYVGAIPYIEMDKLIANFHLNNLHNGFVAGTMISFNNGEPDTDEAKKAIETNLKKKFTGTDKAGEIVVTFSNGVDNAPTVIPLRSNDFEKQFDVLGKTVQENIFVGHKVTSGMLFGVKTEGQLGGRTELLEAYEHFKNTYITNKQQILESVFNYLASLKGLSERLTIIPSEPISYQFSEATVTSVMKSDEIRLKAGLTVENNTEEDVDKGAKEAQNQLKGSVGGVQGVIQIVTSVQDGTISAESAVALLMELFGFSEEIARKTVGLPSDKFASQKADWKKDIEVFKKYGISKAGFEFVAKYPVQFASSFEAHQDELLQGRSEFRRRKLTIDKNERAILDLIEKDPLISPNEIAKVLKISVTEINKSIKRLEDQGAVKPGKNKTRIVTVRGDEIIEANPPAVTKDIDVMYTYEEIKGIPKAVSGSRPFCVEMMQLDRMYTREEIELISAEVGYNVWEKRGGWYHNPKTDILKPSCRHTWVQNLVKKES